MRPTHIVRYVMQRAGKLSVYTNLYKTCRTVKCYAGDAEANAMLEKAVVSELALWGITNVKIRMTPGTKSWGGRPGFVVELPL